MKVKRQELYGWLGHWRLILSQQSFQTVDRDELKDELCILQGLVETKENMMQAMREEARRNANLLLSAAKTRDVRMSI